jgi:hypothetical protein
MSALTLALIAVWLIACLVFATDVPGKTALFMPVLLPIIFALLAIHFAALGVAQSTYAILHWLRDRYWSLADW